MNILQAIANDTVRIPRDYRIRNSIEVIKKDLERIDFESVTNPHLFNLRALCFPSAKKVASIKAWSYAFTGDLEIDSEEHSYMANGIPVHNTINVPENTPIEEFRDLYQYGYDKGVKGATTFRYNPEVFAGVLVKEEDLKNTTYEFTLEDGTTVEVTGDQKIEYEGEEHNAAMLFDAIKEGQYHSGY